MELTSEDAFGQSLANLQPAPDHHTPNFGDDVGHFVQDLGQPRFGHTGATFRAAFDSALENDIGEGISDDYAVARQYQPVVDALNRAQGRHPGGAFDNGNMVVNPVSPGGFLPSDFLAQQRGGSGFNDGVGFNNGYGQWFWGQVAQERQRNPGLFANLPTSHAEAVADARQEQRTAHDYAATLASSGGPLTGSLPSFAGGVAGGFADPVNLATTVVGFPASESLLKTALIEGAGNAAITAATLPERAQHYADIGEPMSAGDMAGDVAGAGLLGAGIGVGGKLLGRVLGLHGQPLLDEFQAQNPDPSPSLRTAANVVDDRINLEATNPFDHTPDGLSLHQQALEMTQAALDNRDPGQLPSLEGDLPRLDPNEAEIAAAADDVAHARSAMPDEPGLLHEIRSLGGIKVRDARGDLTREGAEVMAVLKDRPVPGLISNKGGRTPDYLREALQERGWFGAGKGDDISELYDLIGREASGEKVYHPDSDMRQQRSGRAGLDEEMGRAGIGAGDSGAEAAEKLARWRLASADGHDSALAFWRQQADLSGVDYDGNTQPEDLMADVLERDAVRAERDGTLDDFADSAEAMLRAHIDRLYPDLKDEDLERQFRDYEQRGAAGASEGEGGGSGDAGEGARGAAGDDTFARGYRESPQNEHFGRQNPEALKSFSDPIKKPDAFREQAADLAREVAPAPERDEAPEGGEPSPYGDAAPLIDAMDRLPQDASFADPASETVRSIKDAGAEMKRQARAVERLRGCVEED